MATLGQWKPSIQGVWWTVELTITTPNPVPGARGKGAYINLQPSLAIFTGTHIKLDASNLWITTTENAAGKIEYPITFRYTRVE